MICHGGVVFEAPGGRETEWTYTHTQHEALMGTQQSCRSRSDAQHAQLIVSVLLLLLLLLLLMMMMMMMPLVLLSPSFAETGRMRCHPYQQPQQQGKGGEA